MIQEEFITAPKASAMTPYGVVGKPLVGGALIFVIMKTIELSMGYVTIVDDDDYEELSKHKWYVYKGSTVNYAGRKIGKRNDSHSIHMHRQILGDDVIGLHTDHIDGDGLNNQRSNLRPCTPSQNQCNKRSMRGSSSKYVGICHVSVIKPKTKRKKRWKAAFRVNGKSVFIGMFMTEYEAALAKDQYILDNNLEFNRLNILKRPE